MMSKVKFLKNKVFFLLSIIFIIFIGAACSSNTGAGDTKKTNVSTSESGNVDKDLPISRYEASFDVDLEDLPTRIGAADYVFIGTVVSMDKTEYLHISPMEFIPEGEAPENYGSPHTYYTVKVINNIKGELVTDKDIVIRKDGGISFDKSQYFLYEEDVLPEVGLNYVFYGYAQDDGELLLSGPYSNTEISVNNSNSISDFENSSDYQELVNAYKSEKKIDRERSISIYDINFKP